MKPAFAQSISKPSVPEFTVQYFDKISNITPTTSVNPYTGKNVTTGFGYTFHNETIVFTIKNQPFTPYNDSEGNYIEAYYNFRYKEQYQDQWTYLPFNPDGQTGGAWGSWLNSNAKPYFPKSYSSYTTKIFILPTFVGYPNGNSGPEFPDGGQLDFEVQAQIGNISNVGGGSLSLGSCYNFTGQSSDWSNPQTVNIPANTTLPSPTPLFQSFRS